MESILTSIKKMLGIAEEYTQFDMDIIIYINSVFTTLMQLGVGPSKGFYIEDDIAEWTDFISDLTNLQAVKTYVFLRVKLLFDPGSLGSATLAAYERQIQELEWRLNIEAESTAKSDVDDTVEPDIPDDDEEPVTPTPSSHTHANKKILDTYDMTQTELLVEAKTEIKNLVEELKDTVNAVIEQKADKATTLDGYGITDAYNKDEVDESLKTITDDLNSVEGILSDSY